MLCVAIARSNVSLGGSAITVATPRGDEGGQVTVILVETDTVISIPSVKDCFPGAVGDGLCLVKWNVMGLSSSMNAQGLEFNCWGRCVILF